MGQKELPIVDSVWKLTESVLAALAAACWYAVTSTALCRPARFLCTNGAPDALTLLGAAGVSCMGVAPGSSGSAGDAIGGVMIAGVLLRGCCIGTELARASACTGT